MLRYEQGWGEIRFAFSDNHEQDRQPYRLMSNQLYVIAIHNSYYLTSSANKLQTRAREGNQAGFYKHLKTMGLEGKRERSSAYVKDKDGVILRDVEIIRERCVRWFHTPLNAKCSIRTLPKGLTSGPRTCH